MIQQVAFGVIVLRLASCVAVNTGVVSLKADATVQSWTRPSAQSIVRSAKHESSSPEESNDSIQAASAPRRIYIDLGANWANTLRLFEDVGEKRSETPWDVYGFEASPLIQPYLEKFVGWLNGKNSKPPVLVPPSGSSEHLAAFAPHYGCPTDGDAMRECMFKRFKSKLDLLKPDPTLNNVDLINSRLSIATTPPGNSNRFTAVPAAVGDHFGILELGMVSADQMIRGGAHDEAVGNVMNVTMVDFPKWFVANFKKEDYIIVKMDIEGGEFGILNELLSGPNACLIDFLAMECHPIAGDCPALEKRLKENSCMSVIYEGTGCTAPDGSAGYTGLDHYSTPDKYYPEAPEA